MFKMNNISELDLFGTVERAISAENSSRLALLPE